MEIQEVTTEEYDSVMGSPLHIYNSASFNFLNQSKCERVHFLIFKNEKVRLGLIGGIIHNEFLSPFSAPFGGFSYLKHDVNIRSIEEAIVELIQWTKNMGYSKLHFIMPPLIYSESFLSKMINTFHRKNFSFSQVDLNYAFDLTEFTSEYLNNIWYNARKNLKISLNRNLSFIQCNNIVDKKNAYLIIKINRKEKGFPLKMSWEQIYETTKLITADFFLVKDSNDCVIASAIIFHVTNKIVQVIYWGDIPDYVENKTMNFLSFKIFEFYKELNYHYVDIGPSTLNSEPNYGLGEFKESIGCKITPKYQFCYNIVT